VEHALAAGDYDDVIRQIEQGAGEIFQGSQLNTLLRWWAGLPRELVTSQPKLCMIYAWAWVATGHLGEAEGCLQAIEQALGIKMTELYAEGGEAKAMDPAIRAALVEVVVVRAELAIERGNIADALKLSHLVLPYLEDDEGPYLHNPPKASRTVVFFIMGMAHKLWGELGAADKALSEAAALGQERGNVHIVAVAYGHLASGQAIQGHLHQAVQTCRRGLQLVQEMAGRRSPMSGLLRAELGNLLCEQNDLEAALHHLQESIAVAKPWGFWDALVPGYTGLARLRVAQGDWGRAFAVLDELAALGQNNPQAVMPAVESLRAMLWAAQGKVDAARRWAQASGLGDGELIYLRERETIILARVLMAQKKWDEAARLIDRLMDAAETGKRWGRVVELLILQTLALDAQEKQDEALTRLARALALAEPGGYVRIFVDQGEPMAELLQQAAARGISADYVGRLLEAFGDATKDEGRKTELFPSSSVLGHSSLVEPLSERELEVLRLLKTELSGPEIADELTIALSTLRTHTQNIYTKLNVNNRRAAVNRAEELGLV
jgi:LuxR family maltose regulon positive regulatory protein